MRVGPHVDRAQGAEPVGDGGVGAGLGHGAEVGVEQRPLVLEADFVGDGEEVDGLKRGDGVGLDVTQVGLLGLDVLAGAQAGQVAAHEGLEIVLENLVVGPEVAGHVLGQRPAR